MKNIYSLLILSLVFLTTEINAQLAGCTDGASCNYNSSATIDDGTCTDEPVWFIPVVPTNGFGNTPAVLVCDPPNGYVLANQCCVSQVIELDPFCTTANWDSVCQGVYEECLTSQEGCRDITACNYDPCATVENFTCTYSPVWYIPKEPTSAGGSSPVILSCGPTEGYVLANQCCVESIMVSDLFCVDNTWDSLCQEAYDDCVETGDVIGCADPDACNYVECVTLSNGSCNYEKWYIPEELGVSPVIFSCNAPEGFVEANQCALENLIANDPFCLTNSYDFTCQNNYDALIEDLGCTDIAACNYDFFAVCGEEFCDYSCYGCTNADACNYDPLAFHVDSYCDYFSCENEEDFFITVWQTSVQDESIVIRPNMSVIIESDLELDYFVDWGDGTFSNHVTLAASHVYEIPDVYEISIRGQLPAIRLASEFNNDEITNILEVTQWGNNNWSSMNSAFSDCPNLEITATDAPDLSSVFSCAGMFSGCEKLNGGLSNWDVSHVRNMASMFNGASSFNGDISAWDVSLVFFTANMFRDCLEFNQDISSWDVSRFRLMSYMFSGAESFNQDIGSWDVSSAEDMSFLFNFATLFNQDLGSWDLSSATNLQGMFSSARSFNQDIGLWNVANVNFMRSMFLDASSFNQNIDMWDVSSVTDMVSMFSFARNFNQDISSWNVSSVESMVNMFNETEMFNQDISTWDVSNVTSMSLMFNEAEMFNQDIGSWDVSSVTEMNYMFKNAEKFNQSLGSWDLSNVSTTIEMFSGAKDFNQDIGSWDVSNVSNMNGMFARAEEFNQDIGSWNVSNVNNVSQMFAGADSFNQDINSWDVSNVTSLWEMFAGAESFNQDLSSWDVSNVDFMRGVFNFAISFNQDISSWDVSNVTSFERMFYEAESFDQDLSNWNFENTFNMIWFLRNSGMSTENYDLLLEGLAGQSESLQPNVNFGAEGINYCQSESARDLLLSEPFNWFITDDGRFCVGCAGDINYDGVVSSQDLSIFLSSFGNFCETDLCPEDLNGDGQVNISDLSAFLSSFGNECM
ncbi:MAG: BspA family leucine-rich repeat surface protein [Flavobacteriales bacterium]